MTSVLPGEGFPPPGAIAFPRSSARSVVGETKGSCCLPGADLQYRQSDRQATVLNLQYFMAGRCEAWSASGNSVASMSFEMGPENRSKRAAWTVVEGASAAGQVSVWDTGECQLEVYEVESGCEIVNETIQVNSADDLGSVLRRVLALCC